MCYILQKMKRKKCITRSASYKELPSAVRCIVDLSTMRIKKGIFLVDEAALSMVLPKWKKATENMNGQIATKYSPALTKRSWRVMTRVSRLRYKRVF